MRYVVGIDLGTTNSALCSADLRAEDDPASSISALPVPQLIAPGERAERPLLPSSLYLLEGPELPRGSASLPWTKGDLHYIAGEFARLQGALVPGRLVQSAKSWLCHPGVDREAPILPWGATDDLIQKVSPLEASSRLLEHLKGAWNLAHPSDPLEAQEIILTVPASFDDVARELTLRAARRAGLAMVRLLEEPQAAFYSFLLSHRDRLADALDGVSTVLVVDVGGGTTDFSLIEVTRGGALPQLRRIAVGEHILLGGDNIDQALARRVEARTVGEGKLDGARFAQLVQACRLAKEALLDPDGPSTRPIAVLSRGSRLLGAGTLSTELTREEVSAVVLDGFFPRVGLDASPSTAARAGLKEWGLPYASDASIPAHLAAFLREHPSAVPDAILCNGGVLSPRVLTERVAEIVGGWFPGRALRMLPTASLELAVARGAAAYGLTRRGFGISIGGGVARGYYLGIEPEGATQRAICLIPKGSEEGAEFVIDRGLRLRVGRPVRFPLYTAAARRDESGAVLALDERYRPLPALQAALEASGGPLEVPVALVATVTELGTLSLSVRAKEGGGHWRLEFDLKERPSSPTREVPEPGPHPRAKEAQSLIQSAFAERSTARDAKGLAKGLEKLLGRERGEWPTALCRDLFDALRERAPFRFHSAETEGAWLNLSGFLLRPGFGAKLDDWRVRNLWRIATEGLTHPQEKQTRLEWWIFWRRVAGGLSAEAQEQIFNTFAARLRAYGQEDPPSDPKLLAARDQEIDEVVRLSASLERLPEARRAELGGLYLQRAERWGARGPLLWAVGRLGARVLFYGSGHEVVRRSIVERWLRRLLALDWKNADGALLAASQLARRTGDRDTDLDEALRLETLSRLETGGASAALLTLVREIVPAEAKIQSQVFGENLPTGFF